MTPVLRNDKCTKNDYRQLFAESAEPLHWLCYTLTGDKELSDRVLDAALEQSLKGAEQVFREWMVSWARRLITKVCIATVQPSASRLAEVAYPLWPVRLGPVDPDRLAAVLNLPSELLQQKLLRLAALSRFVFVLRALEGYSRRETSLLLNIDDRACEWIYLWAARDMQEGVMPSATKWHGETASEGDYSLAMAGD